MPFADEPVPNMRLRALAALRAARDFGLEPTAAAAIALREPEFDRLIDALADALVRRGAVRLPESA